MSLRWFLLVCLMAVVVAWIGEPRPWNLVIALGCVTAALWAYLRGDEVGP